MEDFGKEACKTHSWNDRICIQSGFHGNFKGKKKLEIPLIFCSEQYKKTGITCWRMKQETLLNYKQFRSAMFRWTLD